MCSERIGQRYGHHGDSVGRQRGQRLPALRSHGPLLQVTDQMTSVMLSFSSFCMFILKMHEFFRSIITF